MVTSLRGLVLAGGEGSRLRPLTLSVHKHLTPLAGRVWLSIPLAI